MLRHGGLATSLLVAMSCLVSSAKAQDPVEELTERIDGIADEATSGELAAPATPPWLEYQLSQVVTNGGGVYEGWSDRLTATGHYDFDETAEPASVRARYHWRYHSPDDDRQGAEDRAVSYDAAARLYRQAQIDLDDYDDRAPRGGRAIWWRIPTGLATGATIDILDEEFVVMGPVPGNDHTHGRPSILVEKRGGTGTRNDAYGSYRTTFTDQYWFDAETGWFLREVYTEHDIGTLDGDYASFDVEESVEADGASYLPGTTAMYDYTAPERSDGRHAIPRSGDWEESSGARSASSRRFLVYGAIGVAILVFGIWLFRRSRPKHDFDGSIRRVAADEALPGDLASQTDRFGPLLPHLVRQTLSAGLPVAIAKSSTGTAGIALGAPPGEAATIFARDTAACEALRRELGAEHFFSEIRHEHAFAARAAASQHNTPLTGNHAYNVLETHDVLTVEPLPEGVSYDTGLIRRAKAEDLPAVIALADKTYGTSCKGWIEAAHKTGDVVLVARKDDAVVGFSIVSVAGTTARFHGLTVAADHRGKGIGKELNRARVKVAHDLGAERAVVEVAAWNVASLEIARAAGFTRAGQMFVQTASGTKTDAKFQRR